MAVTDVQFASGRMSTVRIALANIRYATTPDESVALSCRAIHGASAEQAAIICFPECYVPGYRAPGKTVPPPDVTANVPRASATGAPLLRTITWMPFARRVFARPTCWFPE